MKRQLLVLGVLLMLVAPGLVGFAPPHQARAGLILSASAGYNGYHRQGQWIPVRVNARNDGDDLDGYIRVRFSGSSSLDETVYRTPLDLPRGSNKQVFLYVSPRYFTQHLQIEFVEQGGQIIERVSADLFQANANDILYAVVTASPLGAVDLTGHFPGAGSAYQANWQIDHIPPLADALAGLDVLMFHDIDTGALKAEQTAAILGWVRSGGHLVIAGGETWQRTTAGFQDILPVTLQGTAPVESLAALADDLQLPAAPLDQPATVTLSQPGTSAQVLTATGDVPLVVRRSYGRGVVDYLAFDPNAEPLRSWADKGWLWYALVSSTGQQPSWRRGFLDWNTGREATLTTSNSGLPTFIQLCGFLVLYMILIGPVNYLVLKRLNRREWAWFTIPFLIFLFSGLAYLVGFNLRGNTPSVNRLTVVQVWDDSEQAQVLGLIGVQSPRRSVYDIAVDRGYVLRPLPQVDTGLGIPVTISEGTRYVAQEVPIDAGTIASFTTSGTTPAPRLDAAATWHLGNHATPRITGAVTNPLGVPLEDAVILIKGESRFLGTLLPGQSASFDISMGPQAPGPVGLGSQRTGYTGQYTGGWYYPYNSPGYCFSYSGVSLTIADIMRNEPFPCAAGRVSEREQEIRRRYRLLAALISDTDLSGGRDSGAYLVGWTKQAVVNVDLVGKSYKAEDTTLYIFELPVRVTADESRVEIPPGLTLWTVAETDDPATQLELTPTQFRLVANGQAAFAFMPMPAFQPVQIDEVLLHFQGQGPLKIELWNWDRQQWVSVQLDPNSTTTSIARPAAFLGINNAVHVRITTLDPVAYNQVDYVKISYRGRWVE